MDDKTTQAPEKSPYTTVTLPRSLRDHLREVRDLLAEEGSRLLPPSLHARWEAAQRTADGRPRGNTGLSVVIELMAQALKERLAAERKGGP